ncbi:MAG: tRNA uridine-5-carboxymethylaminomethyl(34) synthesis enzyme MnmG [Bacillota bacterium]|jgi:tRNA uridine 5-carboxymethylaminomethyl modification enzyme|nr:tRNA uridine-5-carboxymethylaminomethyl(34) synthesis enzyme MnmG [Bacillota bacterium]NLM08165.1 tRNA uridine-5-carboxymethylaminomethyl(34) synthesis enzyme MnmG [Clostridiales Family XIII bacterium]
MGYLMGEYDVIVVGAGHAGCEAALVCARMGKKTLILSMNLEAIAMLACNPSIGGSGKGHLVREIDALGGQMGLAIDEAFIQSRMLNTSKGPAVHSLRVQADKTLYHQAMKRALEQQEELDLKQGEVVELIIEDQKVKGVMLNTGAVYLSKVVILATGTFLGGRIFIGEYNFTSGPNGLAPSLKLAEHLKKQGFAMRRFKTGTPARVKGSSLNYDAMIEQPGDEEIVPFSFMNEKLEREQISCWLTYTNEETHEIIRKNFERSALFGGQIEGVGPRYCPSIEDKVKRFADKERHQLFIEPEGLYTEEMYVQGMSSSLPEDVQELFYKTIPGLENVKIVRPAYAIEYDCIDPLELQINLEHRKVENLFCAGQFNGSSGYEEAAAQGLMAGINAVLKLNGREPFILDRSEAYIGVLIDDLITKGTNEPYRIMTSRAEYRLVLRQDNAEERLTEKGYRVGAVPKERYEAYLSRKEAFERELKRLNKTIINPAKANEFLESIGSSPVKKGISLAELLRRPETSYELLAKVDPEREPLSKHIITSVEVHIKYEGYITKQEQQIERFRKLENQKLPEDLDYMSLDGLRIEARQKLNQHRPLSLGQASRISGVSPADINVLMIHLERMRRRSS